MRLYFQILIILTSLFILSCGETPEYVTKIITCTTIDDCPDDNNCINGFCKKNEEVIIEECLDDSGCPSGFFCNDLLQCEQKLCESKADCGTGKICLNTKCIEGCETNIDCDSDETCNTQLRKCEKGEDCRIENNCAQGYECNQLSGVCIAKSTCVTNSDCADGYTCEASQCIAKVKCNNDQECANGEVCRADGYCDIDIGCDSDDYCVRKSPNKPACSMNSGICYECVSDTHCTGIGEICDTLLHTCGTTNTGGECQTDSDCGLNKRCNTSVNPHECIDMMTSCTSDNDCQNGMHCDSSNGRCVMCLNDTQCVSPKTCNLNTNLCEDGGNTGENGLCADLTGQLTCLLSGGTCDYNDNCIMPETEVCDASTCSAYPNTYCEVDTADNQAYCYCNDGYHLNDAETECVSDNVDLCENVNCPTNASCDSSDGTCYCNDGYTATDTDNNGTKDSCIQDQVDPCASVTCSNHGDCINNNGTATCNCDAGYHLSGLNCILDSQTCTVDEFSNPLNNTPTSAKTISFGSYSNLTLSNSICGYVEDWYKIQLYENTELNLDLSFIDSNGDIDVELYKQSNTNNDVANSGGVTNTESITYTVTQSDTYYIRVYIYFESDQRVNTYSMTLSSRAIQSGNPGSECDTDNACYGTNSYCVDTYTANGYCTADCTTDGATCMDTGVCSSGNCFKKCTIDNDSSCSRSDLVCEDDGSPVGGVCVEKCSQNSDCYSNYCKVSTGHCEINYTDCNDDPVTNSGCSTSETCFDDGDGYGTYCYPNNNLNIGAACEYLNDCKAGDGCVGNDSDGYYCTEFCTSDYDCSDYNVCTYFSGENFGYCN